MSHENIAAAVDGVEFFTGELLVVGGDYGQITLEGATEEARRAVESLVACTRRGDSVAVSNARFAVDYRQTLVVENRHAGREGTPERGVGGADAAGSEPAGAEGVASPGDASGTLADSP
jgi:hypothetical protein